MSRPPPRVRDAVPSDRDRAATELDELLAVRIACFTDGRCPRCEATFADPVWTEPSVDGKGGLGRLPMEHERWCPVPDSEAMIRRLVRRHGFTLRRVVVVRGRTMMIGATRA